MPSSATPLGWIAFAFRLAAVVLLIVGASLHGEQRLWFGVMAIVAALWEVCTRLSEVSHGTR